MTCMTHIIFVFEGTGLDGSNENVLAFITDCIVQTLLIHQPAAPTVVAMSTFLARNVPSLSRGPVQPCFSGPCLF